MRRDNAPDKSAHLTAAKPDDETIFRERCNHPAALCRRNQRVDVARMSSMLEVAIALLGLFSAGIFLAHAVEAYRAR